MKYKYWCCIVFFGLMIGHKTLAPNSQGPDDHKPKSDQKKPTLLTDTLPSDLSVQNITSEAADSALNMLQIICKEENIPSYIPPSYISFIQENFIQQLLVYGIGKKMAIMRLPMKEQLRMLIQCIDPNATSLFKAIENVSLQLNEMSGLQILENPNRSLIEQIYCLKTYIDPRMISIAGGIESLFSLLNQQAFIKALAPVSLYEMIQKFEKSVPIGRINNLKIVSRDLASLIGVGFYPDVSNILLTFGDIQLSNMPKSLAEVLGVSIQKNGSIGKAIFVLERMITSSQPGYVVQSFYQELIKINGLLNGKDTGNILDVVYSIRKKINPTSEHMTSGLDDIINELQAGASDLKQAVNDISAIIGGMESDLSKQIYECVQSIAADKLTLTNAIDFLKEIIGLNETDDLAAQIQDLIKFINPHANSLASAVETVQKKLGIDPNGNLDGLNPENQIKAIGDPGTSITNVLTGTQYPEKTLADDSGSVAGQNSLDGVIGPNGTGSVKEALCENLCPDATIGKKLDIISQSLSRSDNSIQEKIETIQNMIPGNPMEPIDQRLAEWSERTQQMEALIKNLLSRPELKNLFPSFSSDEERLSLNQIKTLSQLAQHTE